MDDLEKMRKFKITASVVIFFVLLIIGLLYYAFSEKKASISFIQAYYAENKKELESIIDKVKQAKDSETNPVQDQPLTPSVENNPVPVPTKNQTAQPNTSGKTTDVDFGPYMSALQRKIKSNWKPPRYSESNQIVATFSVNSKGQLSNLKLSKSSPLLDANTAALAAVTKAAPFDPLPAGSDPIVEIEFTFDYNVLKKSKW